MLVVSLYYSANYIKVVKKAHEQGHDVLASYEAMASAWKAASSSEPFALDLVRSAHPQPNTAWAVPAVPTWSVVMNETNFAELRPFLGELRDLILEGDGSGWGRLRCSGYLAQPAKQKRIDRSLSP